MDRLKYHQERLDAKLGFKRDAIDKVLKTLAAEMPEGEIDGEKLLRNAIRKLSF